MWSVSDAYKEAVVKSSRKWKSEVRVTYKNGAQSVFTDETIKNGISIYSQMVSGDAGSNTIDIGAVPEKKIELTLIDSDSDLHRYAGARLSVHISLMLENGEYEKVPMGVFFVDSSAITRQGTNIQIVGYDGMVTFQYNLTDFIRNRIKNREATDAARILASYSSCGFNQDLSGLPNGDLMLDFDSAQVVTGWDGIMWIAQLMGCFCRINRQNNLEFVPIKFEWEYFDEDHTSGRIVETRTIQESERYDNTTFSDDRMHIVGVAMPDDEGYITSGGTGGLEQDANITVLLEKNPIIKKNLKSIPEILEEIRQQLWSVYFYAFKIDIENDPALDAGDVVRLKGGVINGTNKNNDLYGFITHNEWHYRERQTITSSGQMPISEDDTTSDPGGNTQFYIQPKSQSEKLLASLSGSTNQLKEMVRVVDERTVNGIERAKYLQTYGASKFDTTTVLRTRHGARAHTAAGSVGFDLLEKDSDAGPEIRRLSCYMGYTEKTGARVHPTDSIDFQLIAAPHQPMNGYTDRVGIRVVGGRMDSGFRAVGEIFCEGLWIPDDLFGYPREVQLFYAIYENYKNKYRQEFKIANLEFVVTDEGIKITRPATSLHPSSYKTAFIPWNAANEQSETSTAEQVVQAASVKGAASGNEPSYTYDDDGIHISYNGHMKVIPWDT